LPWAKALLAWDLVNPRIARLRLKGRLPNISIITVYAPTIVAMDADKDSFYSDLEITIHKCPKRGFLIFAGDWNCCVSPTDPNVRDIVGPFIYGQRCSNGDRILQFVRSHNRFISKTIFQHNRTFKEVTGKNSPIAGPLKDAQGSLIPDVQGKLDH